MCHEQYRLSHLEGRADCIAMQIAFLGTFGARCSLTLASTDSYSHLGQLCHMKFVKSPENEEHNNTVKALNIRFGYLY